MATTVTKNVYETLTARLGKGLTAEECITASAKGELTMPQCIELCNAITASAVAAVPQTVVVKSADSNKNGCRVSDHYMAKGRIVVSHDGVKTAGLSVQDLAVIVHEMDAIKAVVAAVDFAKTKPVTWRSKTDTSKSGTNLWGKWGTEDVFVCHKPSEFNEDLCVSAAILAQPSK
jgi:hypothetical protein